MLNGHAKIKSHLAGDDVGHLGRDVGGALRAEQRREAPVVRVLGLGAEGDDAREDHVDARENLALHGWDDDLSRPSAKADELGGRQAHLDVRTIWVLEELVPHRLEDLVPPDQYPKLN